MALLLLLLFFTSCKSAHVASTTDGRAEMFINVEQNQIEKVKRWIEQGGNVNVQSANGKTALMRACQHAHVDMVHYLIAAGADVNLQNNRGLSAIGMLSYQTEIISILLDNEGTIVWRENVDNAFADGYILDDPLLMARYMNRVNAHAPPVKEL